MLQIGIMLHSLVIGLTLSVSVGSEFSAYPRSLRAARDELTTVPASLVTAILFHQLFEGLSLGIRIAALPSAPSSSGASPFPHRCFNA